MKKNNSKPKGKLFNTWLTKRLKNSDFKRQYQTEGVKLKIGIRIAELRNKCGMTQTELAKKVGVSQGFIAQLEAAETVNYEIKTLKKIASAIGMVLVIGFMNKSDLSHRTTPIKELVTC